MLKRWIDWALVSRALRSGPVWAIFVIPVIGFVGLAYLRHPVSERPAAESDQDQNIPTEAAPQNRSKDAGGHGALLEPLRSKIIRAKPTEKPASGCAVSDPASGIVTVSAEETPIMLGPSSASKPLKDWNGAQRFLDPRHDLKVLESSGAWVRVSVLGPNWPPGNTGWTGWIERRNIQQADSPEGKNCFFVDPSKWSGVPPSVQEAAKAAGLQILKEDGRCQRISRGGYLGNGQRYYLTCYPKDGARPYHYWLAATNSRKHFLPPPPLDEDAAMLKCRGELQKAMANQALIEGHETEDLQIENFQARRTGVVQQLSLEFRLGENETQKAHCLVAPGGGAEITLGDPQ